MVRILLMVGMIKLLFATDSPALCAGVYTGAILVIRLMLGSDAGAVFLAAAISFALAYAYFWLLNRFQDQGLFYWLIMVVGFFIVLL